MNIISDLAILAQKWFTAMKKVNFLVSNSPNCAILLCVVLGEQAGGGSVAVGVSVITVM